MYAQQLLFMEASPSPLSSREPVTFSIFSCFSCIPSPRQSRHPERSASQIDRKQRLYGAESKDPGDACWQMLLGAFRPQTTTEDKKITTSERSRPVPACRGGICSFTPPRPNPKGKLPLVQQPNRLQKHLAHDRQALRAQLIDGVLRGMPKSILISVIEIDNVGARHFPLHKRSVIIPHRILFLEEIRLITVLRRCLSHYIKQPRRRARVPQHIQVAVPNHIGQQKSFN